MEKRVQKTLEEAGYRFMDAEDFIGLTEDERQLVELRTVLRRNIRLQREKAKLTQQQLAAKIRSSQPRVAKLEAGASDVSLDLMFRAFFAAGGRLADLAGLDVKPAATKKSRRRPPAAVAGPGT